MKNKKNIKKRIDTYSTQFDIDVIVCNKAVTLEDLNKLFKHLDNTELNKDFVEWCAISCMVTRKKDGAKVYLIKYNKKGTFVSSGNDTLDLIDTASHEAMHAVLDIYNSVGARIDIENQESTAYFLGYLTERVAKTLLNL